MTKYAYYDSTVLPNDQVIGWIDSEVEKNMPAAATLLEMTDAQWEERSTDIFFVVGGVLTGAKTILSMVQPVQKHMVSSACAAQIVSGFASSALGAAHTYASGDIDQQNIVQSAQSTKGGLLSCADSTGAWSRQPHTQAQAQQVLEDFVAARDAARTKLSGLEVQVNTATTVAAAQAVTWGA